MKSNSEKIGAVLSHLHVRPGEEFKFDMLQYTISHLRGMRSDFFIVLSGHGVSPPDHITAQVDEVIWKDSIVDKEIGVGHPWFCVESFKELRKRSIQKLIKLRSCDVILNEDLFEKLINSDADLILTEQTCLNRGMIGDLLMMGKTDKVMDLWTSLPWDYGKSGLYNLFDNASFLASQYGTSTSNYLKNNAKFITPVEINWVTLEQNWNNAKATLEKDFSSDHLWGASTNYPYYGGF
tara:strand:+ start:749 stop:1459 length:711 start_codon:yes stop_codon:yes gene_type:complete